MVSEDGVVESTTSDTAYKKYKVLYIFLFRFLSIERPPVHMNRTQNNSLCFFLKFYIYSTITGDVMSIYPFTL